MSSEISWTLQDAKQKTHAGLVLRGLNQLRNTGMLLDVILHTDGRKFEAHRIVLAACSDYFLAMFTEPMKESREKEIRLYGVTAIGVEVLLEYAYTSKLELTPDNIDEVLSAASHLQMDKVVHACANYLGAQLTLENCIDIVTIAETYSLVCLKKIVYRFMCEHLLEFSKTTEFCRLAWYQLEYILKGNEPVYCSEIVVLRIVLKWMKFADLGETKLYTFN